MFVLKASKPISFVGVPSLRIRRNNAQVGNLLPFLVRSQHRKVHQRREVSVASRPHIPTIPAYNLRTISPQLR